MVLDDGEIVPGDATLWTTEFWASPLAAESEFAVDARGRIVVDATLRSVSHPSVFAIGDAAAIRLAWGEIHGTCQSGIRVGPTPPTPSAVSPGEGGSSPSASATGTNP